MPRHGTGEGQKVTLGKDAPVTREGAGAVPDESLAAESVREGGAFAQNRDAEPRAFDGSKQQSTSTGPSAGHGQHHQQQQQSQTSSYAAEGQGAAAPGYVDAQFLAKGGPHGKNLHEGGFEGSGPGSSIEAEPGSKDDPGRMAEQGFIGGEGRGGRGARQPGSSSGGGGGGFEGEQPYGALSSETSS